VQILFSRPPRLHLLKSLSLKSRTVVIQAVAAILVVAVIQAVAATPVAAVIRAVAVTPVMVAIRAVVVIPVAVMATEMAVALRERIVISN